MEEFVSWLRDGTVFLSPDKKDPDNLEFPRNPLVARVLCTKLRGCPCSLF